LTDSSRLYSPAMDRLTALTIPVSELPSFSNGSAKK
jgi:hypothetical protein